MRKLCAKFKYMCQWDSYCAIRIGFKASYIESSFFFTAATIGFSSERRTELIGSLSLSCIRDSYNKTVQFFIRVAKWISFYTQMPLFLAISSQFRKEYIENSGDILYCFLKSQFRNWLKIWQKCFTMLTRKLWRSYVGVVEDQKVNMNSSYTKIKNKYQSLTYMRR